MNRRKFLSGLIFILILFSQAFISQVLAADSTTMTFVQVTKTSQLSENNYYMVTNTNLDNLYSLNASVSTTYSSPVTASDGTIVLNNVNLENPSNIFTLVQKSGSPNEYYFQTGVTSTLRLKLDSGNVFNTNGTELNLTSSFVLNSNNMWNIYGSTRYLNFNNDTFSPNNSASDLYIWMAVDTPTFTDYYRFNNISELNSIKDPYYMVLTIPSYTVENNTITGITYDANLVGRFTSSTGAYSSWYTPTSTDPESMSNIIVNTGSSVSISSDLTNGSYNFTAGTVAETDNETYWKYNYLNTGGYYWYTTSWNPSNQPYRSNGNSNNVRFDYEITDDGTVQIYLRGNANNTWLGFSPSLNQYVACTPEGTGSYSVYNSETSSYDTVSYEDAVLVPINIYTTVNEETATEVIYNFDGQQLSFTKTNQYLGLPWLPDQTIGGVTYTFLGWTEDSDVPNYLDTVESANLYSYDPVTDTGSYSETAYTNYGLLGNGNVDTIPNITISELQDEEGTTTNPINLYGIFARRGFEQAVFSYEEESPNDPIVGIADWKSNQDLTGYSDYIKEKWLGTIYVNVYRDGEIWAESAPMYFAYHNDNNADVNIKFVWNSILNESPYDGNLEMYMNDILNFPAYCNNGNYVIDAVYAEQTGSEIKNEAGVYTDGILYQLNWLDQSGGQLDNVVGGTTLDVYVTSVYNAAYYLDDNLINYSSWTTNYKDNYVTTPGTEDAFEEVFAGANVPVTTSNVYSALMNRNTASGIYVDSTLSRGGSETFAYKINTYNHSFLTGPAPTPIVPPGRELESTSWTLIGENGTPVQEDIAWNSEFEVEGTDYGTGNTIYAYEANPTAIDPATFHFYAYTKEGTTPAPTAGQLIVEKQLASGLSSTEEFNFTVTFKQGDVPYSNQSVTYIYSNGEETQTSLLDSLGQMTFTLTPGQYITFLNLPINLNYSLEEEEVTGYYCNWSNQSGAIVATGKLATALNIPEDPNTGTITVVKKAPEAASSESFDFLITLTNSDGSYYNNQVSYSLSNTTEVKQATPTNGQISFSLNPNGSIVFVDIPYGVSYTVEEMNLTGYTVSWNNQKGTVSTQTPEMVATATNTKNGTVSEPEITISKTQAVNNGNRTANQVTVNGSNTITYYMVITNTSDTVANNIVVTDSVPTGLTLIPEQSSMGATTNDTKTAVSWTIDTLNPGESTTVSFVTTVPSNAIAGTVYSNTAYATLNNAKVTSNTVTAVVPSATVTNTTTTTTTSGSPKTGVETELFVFITIILVASSVVVVRKLKFNK